MARVTLCVCRRCYIIVLPVAQSVLQTKWTSDRNTLNTKANIDLLSFLLLSPLESHTLNLLSALHYSNPSVRELWAINARWRLHEKTSERSERISSRRLFFTNQKYMLHFVSCILWNISFMECYVWSFLLDLYIHFFMSIIWPIYEIFRT